MAHSLVSSSLVTEVAINAIKLVREGENLSMKAQGKLDCALRMLDISSQPNHVGPVNAFTSVKLLKKLLRTKASKRILDWDVKDTLNDNRMSGQNLFSEEVLAKTKEAMKLAAPRELRVADQSTAQKGKNAVKPTIKVQSVSYSLSKQGPHFSTAPVLYRSSLILPSPFVQLSGNKGNPTSQPAVKIIPKVKIS